MSMLIAGKDAVRANADALRRQALKDESPSVRIAAAEALATYGTNDDFDASLKVLLEVGHPKKNTIYNSLAALNVIDRLGDRARPALKELQSWPTEGTPTGHRAGPGIERLLTSIKGRFEKAK
jgi:uncharacterized sulfatase